MSIFEDVHAAAQKALETPDERWPGEDKVRDCSEMAQRPEADWKLAGS
jgi:hypothetical protein